MDRTRGYSFFGIEAVCLVGIIYTKNKISYWAGRRDYWRSIDNDAKVEESIDKSNEYYVIRTFFLFNFLLIIL